MNEFVRAVDEEGKPINVKFAAWKLIPGLAAWKLIPGLAAWKLIPGAEGEKLPFGDTLPAYTFWGNVAELTSVK
jgi:hypothetical protein